MIERTIDLYKIKNLTVISKVSIAWHPSRVKVTFPRAVASARTAYVRLQSSSSCYLSNTIMPISPPDPTEAEKGQLFLRLTVTSPLPVKIGTSDVKRGTRSFTQKGHSYPIIV